jgi:agmatine deiminase
MPAFDDPADAAAKFTLESLFPDRTVVQVPALDIVRGGGGIHCAALNQPAIHSR